jgi:hypothetical protein
MDNFIRVYKQEGLKAILQKGTAYSVVWFTQTNVQAHNYFKKDSTYCAMKGQEGLDYVSNWVSLKTARKRFKQLLGE